jgi:hypothetical protein
MICAFAGKKKRFEGKFRGVEMNGVPRRPEEEWEGAGPGADFAATLWWMAVAK